MANATSQSGMSISKSALVVFEPFSLQVDLEIFCYRVGAAFCSTALMSFLLVFKQADLCVQVKTHPFLMLVFVCLGIWEMFCL